MKQDSFGTLVRIVLWQHWICINRVFKPYTKLLPCGKTYNDASVIEVSAWLEGCKLNIWSIW